MQDDTITNKPRTYVSTAQYSLNGLNACDGAIEQGPIDLSVIEEQEKQTKRMLNGNEVPCM